MPVIKRKRPKFPEWGRPCTVPQLEALTGIPRQTLYEKIRDGEIPSQRIGTRVLVPFHGWQVFVGPDEPTPKKLEA